ncbi:hypothetical protein [Streptomyces sp. NPDC056304]|uniref:hypothetical protein n=1 Tax=Streptomyces sp. NPDC056304 TaxID=3345778 RepID=UPI0035E371FA
MDYYQSYDAMWRHGIENPFEQFDAEVLTSARQLLRQPPVVAARQREAKEDGANHASALAAMMNLAEPGDADLIAESLNSATTSAVAGKVCREARGVRCGASQGGGSPSCRTHSGDATTRRGAVPGVASR